MIGMKMLAVAVLLDTSVTKVMIIVKIAKIAAVGSVCRPCCNSQPNQFESLLVLTM
jgi:hypothetical protein